MRRGAPTRSVRFADRDQRQHVAGGAAFLAWLLGYAFTVSLMSWTIRQATAGDLANAAGQRDLSAPCLTVPLWRHADVLSENPGEVALVREGIDDLSDGRERPVGEVERARLSSSRLGTNQ